MLRARHAAGGDTPVQAKEGEPMKAPIQSQFKASLAMLNGAIDKCPEDLWLSSAYKHAFWRVAYHTLFYADLYLSESVDAFQPWEKHVDELEALGPMMHKGGKFPVEGPPYAKTDIQAYARVILDKLPAAVDALDLDAASGFFWLPFTKLELQIYNIRHIQHHAGQLIERIRQECDEPVEWVGKG